jgi:HSP20 family molecular chaperone IbpA
MVMEDIMAAVTIRRRDSLLEDLEQLQRRIAARAHQLFLDRHGEPGDALGDWLAAEQALLSKTSVDVSERDGVFVMVAHVPQMKPKDLFVDIADQDLLLRASMSHSRSTNTRERSMAGELFEQIRLPKPVDAARATAEWRRGVLTITVPMKRSTATGIRAA